MTDDVSVRLADAGKQFAAKSFDMALKGLAALPSDDPKVRHGSAIVAVVRGGGKGSRGAAAQLKALGPVPSLPISAWAFEGHDAALLNQALLRLHNGEVDAATALVDALVAARAPVAARVAVRAAAIQHSLQRAASKRTGAKPPTAAALNAALETPAFAALPAAEQKELRQLSAVAQAADHTALQALKKDGAAFWMLLANAGVQALWDGHSGAAAQFLAQAVKEMPTGTCALQEATTRFNLGLARLAQGHYQAAVDAMLPAQQALSDSSSFWLRLGQAYARLAADAIARAASTRLDAALTQRVGALCQGVRPTFALLPQQVQAVAGVAQPDDVAAIDFLARAATALQNAYLLLVLDPSTQPETPAPKGRGAKAASAAAAQIPSGAGDEVSAAVARFVATDAPQQMEALQQTLLHLAYVELLRRNATAAAKHAMAYLSVRSEDGAVQWNADRDGALLAMCYASEALCATGRAAAALKLLQNCDLGDLLSAPESGSVAAAANVGAAVGAACLSQVIGGGAWGKAATVAGALLPNLAQTATTPQTQMLAAYIELARGNKEKAVELLSKMPLRAPALS
jgi:hypothetical protein